MLEEIEEMLAILKAIRKYQREVHLLVERAKVMSPTLVNQNNGYSSLYQTLSYTIDLNYSSHGQTLDTHIQQLEVQKKQLMEAA